MGLTQGIPCCWIDSKWLPAGLWESWRPTLEVTDVWRDLVSLLAFQFPHSFLLSFIEMNYLETKLNYTWWREKWAELANWSTAVCILQTSCHPCVCWVNCCTLQGQNQPTTNCLIQRVRWDVNHTISPKADSDFVKEGHFLLLLPVNSSD